MNNKFHKLIKRDFSFDIDEKNIVDYVPQEIII